MSSTPSRRDFLRNAAIFGGGIFFARSVIACAIERAGGETESASSDLVSCATPVISANHGHALVLPQADIEAGEEKTYSIKGSSGHDHLLTVTEAQFAVLAGGGSVTIVSSNDAGHTHSVTVRCSVAGGADASTGDAGPRPDASADAAPPVCSNGARAGSISANHGHSLTVPRADILAGTTRTYSIQGSSSHPHSVTVTAADFTKLKNGQTLTLVSTNDAGHTHNVSVLCS